MTVADLIEGIYVKHVVGTLQTPVTGVFFDSRQVAPGGVFCALKGEGHDGHHYVQAAIDRGAVAILSEQPNPAEFSATWLQVGDARAAMAKAGSNPASRAAVKITRIRA